jgi:putative endonuclease
MDKLDIGKLGEETAENFLTSQNYQIVSKNYRSSFGEIDLVAIDHFCRQPQTVFVEVKTRTQNDYGDPEESINPRKIQKIIKTAIHYLRNIKTPLSWRIDMIAIKLESTGKLKEINHHKNILDGT